MHPAVALDPEGRPMVVDGSRGADLADQGVDTTPSNVVIRGVSPAGLMLRPR
jgi:putative ABC transport system permease protein